jgi:hypothetical protein
MTLRHGYTVDRLDRLARQVARKFYGWAHNGGNVYDLAWSGIAEALYAAAEPPTERQLIHAGMAAVQQEWKQEAHGHGRLGSAGIRQEVGPRFAKFWEGSTVAHFPEDRIVDHVAVRQVLADMPERQRDLLHTVAAHQDLRTAAAALDVPYKTLTARLVEARRSFCRRWYDEPTLNAA